MNMRADPAARNVPASRLTPGPLAFGAVALLVIAALFGGTGGNIPVRGMVIELPAIALLLLALANWPRHRPPVLIIAGLILILALPALQLMPLPFAVWSELPGRDVARDVALMLGDKSWRPMTLDPDMTLKSLLGLLPAFALYLATRQLPVAGRILILRTVVAIGLVSISLGMLQIAARTPALYPFASVHEGYPIGLFANRNHQATLLVVSAVAAAALYRIALDERDRVARIVLPALIAVFGAGVFATGSRTGIALFVLSAILILPLVLGRKPGRRSILIATSLLGIAAVGVSATTVGRTAIERFAASPDDPRFEIWPEVVYSIEHYLPVGAGMGTFVNSFRATEQLAAVRPRYVNRAHSDYIEILVEAGAAGALVVALFLIFFAVTAWQILLRHPHDHANIIARVALVAVLAYLLHSIVDYPLRTFTHLTFFGLFCGLLARPSQSPPDQREAHSV